MRRVKFKVVIKNERTSIYTQGSYSLHYPEGEMVRAVPGTLGVAVFKTRKSAYNFHSTLTMEIIRVRPIGRGRTVNAISRDTSSYCLNCFYNNWQKKDYVMIYVDTMKPPLGTIFYPAVEVLE